MDAYQPIYDAVRSRIGEADTGRAIQDAARQAFDISHITPILLQEITITAYEQRRPFVLLRPRIFPDGNCWCALYGDNLQEGVAGFGETPEKAAIDFDAAWLNQKAAKSA